MRWRAHGYGHLEIAQRPRRVSVRHSAVLRTSWNKSPGEKGVAGYRAPDFSIVENTLWAFEALAEAGYDYDSSVVPVRLVRYGIPEWPILPAQVRLGDGRTVTRLLSPPFAGSEGTGL